MRRQALPAKHCASLSAWFAVAFFTSLGSTALAEIDWSTVPYTTFAEMQAVDGNGTSTWTIPTVGPDDQQAYRVVGVVVNDPSTMLDASPAYADGPMWNMGGQWQIGIQAVDTAETPSELLGDHGGALVWMGQNYGNHIWHYPDTTYSYTDAEWLEEMARLNYPIDASTGEAITEPLRKGDLVEIRARGGLAYKGKFNINEQHDNDPLFDFEIVVLARDVSIEPVAISLSDVEKTPRMRTSSNATRQKRRRIISGRLCSLAGRSKSPMRAAGESYGQITVTDGDGRTFPVRLGVDSCWNTASPPSGTFDLIGLFDQESSSGRGRIPDVDLWVGRIPARRGS